MKCPMCQAGLTASCLGTSYGCSPNSVESPSDSDPSLTLQDSTSTPDAPVGDEEDSDERGAYNKRKGTRLKRDAALRDQQSTGRKRAARWYPLNREAPCEWAGKANCGGGVNPILGCVSGLQEARHHGPDKSVSNNEPGNVHRICHACHNRWHAANNKDYDWSAARIKAHAPQAQSPTEQAQALIEHLALQGKKLKKIKD